MRHIGILAHSAEGAALCFLAAAHEGERLLGAHFHPAITMDIVAMGETLGAWERMDLPPIVDVLAKTAERLKAAGADFFICPDNTAHLALEAAAAPMALPGLHIAEVVAQEAAWHEFRKVALTGTRWTMEGHIYPRELERRGIGCVSPSSADQEIVQTIIFDELVRGVVREESRQAFAAIVAKLKDRGCDCVALSCTELPMLLDDANSPLPTLDSTRLLAEEAVAVALGDVPMPTWRGGPR